MNVNRNAIGILRPNRKATMLLEGKNPSPRVEGNTGIEAVNPCPG